MTASYTIGSFLERFPDSPVTRDVIDHATKTLQLFVTDVYESNALLHISTYVENFQKFQQSFGSVALVMIPVLVVITAFILSHLKKFKVALFVGEISAIAMIFLTYFFPFKAVRFCAGLQIFAYFLSVHSRICSIAQGAPTSTGSAKMAETFKPKSFARGMFKFMREMMMTVSYSMLPRLDSSKAPRFPSIGRITYWTCLSFLVDFCTFVMKEWIPNNMQPANQYFATSLVGGIWVLCSMDWGYCTAIIIFDVMGNSVPPNFRHRHPLLSTSLSEFWGIRWNPIIGKLLQESFYKPLRRFGVPRIVCVLACFTGSALLHAIPQAISTQSLVDAGMMFGFFFFQGVLLLAELIFLKVTGWDKEPTVHSPSSSENLASLSRPDSSTDLISPTVNNNNNNSGGGCSSSNDRVGVKESVENISASDCAPSMDADDEYGTDGNRKATVNPLKTVGAGSTATAATAAAATIRGGKRRAGENIVRKYPAASLSSAAGTSSPPVKVVNSLPSSTMHDKPLTSPPLPPSMGREGREAGGRYDDLKKVKWQWAAELLLVIFVLSSLYCVLEGHTSLTTLAALSGIAAASALTFCFVQYEILLRKHEIVDLQHSSLKMLIALSRRLLFKLCGWVWVWGSVLTVLPLFSVPVTHAFDELWRNSIFVGSIVRLAGSAALQMQAQQMQMQQDIGPDDILGSMASSLPISAEEL